jgi:hypothetical protein
MYIVQSFSETQFVFSKKLGLNAKAGKREGIQRAPVSSCLRNRCDVCSPLLSSRVDKLLQSYYKVITKFCRVVVIITFGSYYKVITKLCRLVVITRHGSHYKVIIKL